MKTVHGRFRIDFKDKENCFLFIDEVLIHLNEKTYNKGKLFDVKVNSSAIFRTNSPFLRELLETSKFTYLYWSRLVSDIKIKISKICLSKYRKSIYKIQSYSLLLENG